jgi:hypothetical protein
MIQREERPLRLLVVEHRRAISPRDRRASLTDAASAAHFTPDGNYPQEFTSTMTPKPADQPAIKNIPVMADIVIYIQGTTQ